MRAASVERGCRLRYGPHWLVLSEHDRRVIVRAILGSMPELVRYCTDGRGSGRAWLQADDFVEAIACAPRMTGFALDDN